MQDVSERILEGKFHHGARTLDFSNPVIELSLEEGEFHEGSFTIFGPENEVTEGVVSSSRLRMKCLTEKFAGSESEIAYSFDADGMEDGDVLKGEFRIISNQGEYLVPYEIKITEEIMESSLGNVRNLFHFANLARTDWPEAVNLFYTEGFEEILKGADRQYYATYKGLIGGSRQGQKVEEFLLEIKKKQKVEFLLEESEIRMDNPHDKEESRIVINRNGWGYSDLMIEQDGDFILLEKEVIRDEDFLGNCYRLPFYIAQEKLHGGKNFGKIFLYNSYVRLEVNVIVIQRTGAARLSGIRLQKKHALIELMQYYEAFRTKRISTASWMKETRALVDHLVEMDDKDASFKLFQVQLLITEERYNEAEWLLNKVDELLAGQFDPVLYCYYLYLTTLINREEAHIDEVAVQVEKIFAQCADNWRIAWLLLYLSEDYSKSPSRKWLILEEQFRQGCKSPVIYVEAWNLIQTNPTLLMRLDNFEMQVLIYAAKRDLLSAVTIEQIIYLAQKQKAYSYSLFRVLVACYKVLPSDEILQTICTLLIKGNITDSTAFSWYEKGIERELRITRLYEYYMMSVKLEDTITIPKIVLMYFAFDSNLDSLHNAFLYAYVYKNKTQYPELYESYKDQIERFMVSQMIKGKNNQWLAYLYKNLITPVMITEETAEGLSQALFIHSISVSRNDIRRIIVIYEKEKQEVVYPVTGKEFYLPLYGNDYQLLLEDSKMNRYCREEEYVLDRLLIPDKLAMLIAPLAVSGHVHFRLWLCEQGRELADISDANIEYMKLISESEEVVDTIRKEIRMRMVQYYYDHDRMKELDDYLALLQPDQIRENSFALIIRFMVIRGMYEKAYEWIQIRDGEGIEAKIIVRLCSRLISMEGMNEDATMTALVYMAFVAGKHDENLLQYLCSYFVGTVKEMRDIWKAAEAFGVDTYDLCERILTQMLYTGAFIGERIDIFKKYVSGGAKTKLELAFLAQCSYDYFVRDKLTDKFVLEDMQRVIERQEDIPLVCQLAYTKYYAENKELVDERISRCLYAFLHELMAQKKYFAYFKEYTDNFTFMRHFADKTIVEYHAKEGSKAIIHYLFEQEGNVDGEYLKEEMRDMFGGICAKQFILFFGERLQYYITEVEDDKEQLTESGTLSRNDTDIEQRESKYSLINDIAIGRTLNDYDTIENLLYEYFEQEGIVSKLFQMI